MLSLTVLATKAPVLIAPAMDSQMWEAAATRENVETLERRGVEIVGPESGRLASGNVGAGRMSEPLTILGAAKLSGRSSTFNASSSVNLCQSRHSA